MRIEIEYWALEKLTPYTRNPRLIPKKAVDKVSDSISEFGFKTPMLVTKEGVLISGHTRLLAAQQLGLSEVPVIVCSDLDEARAAALRLADNRVAQESSWDYELLAVELEELSEFSIDISLSGFDDDEISGMILDEPEIREYTEELEVEDKEPEESFVECPKCKYRWTE